MNRALVPVVLAVVILSSCQSFRERKLAEFNQAPLFGMVYDYEQKPVPAAQLLVDGRRGPQTDINGRFVIEALSRGAHRVKVTKEGFEPLEVQVDYLNRSQVLYLRVVSFNQLLRMAERALEEKRYYQVEDLLSRAAAIDPADPVGLYLRALYQSEKGEVQEAVRTLESVLEAGYRQPVLYLTLADLYQYRLQDDAQALRYLRQYLKLQGDPEARKRLEALEAGQK